jgi:hypothetical protein
LPRRGNRSAAICAGVRLAANAAKSRCPRCSHGYDDVDYQVLWDAVQMDVPVLLATVEKMLQDLEKGEGN